MLSCVCSPIHKLQRCMSFALIRKNLKTQIRNINQLYAQLPLNTIPRKDVRFEKAKLNPFYTWTLPFLIRTTQQEIVQVRRVHWNHRFVFTAHRHPHHRKISSQVIWVFHVNDTSLSSWHILFVCYSVLRLLRVRNVITTPTFLSMDSPHIFLVFHNI